jgi:hypothetical protein
MSHTFYKAGIASGLMLAFLLPLSALAGDGPVGWPNRQHRQGHRTAGHGIQ